MAINKEQYKQLLKRLDIIQNEIEEIQQALLNESEYIEIKSIQKENDFRTLEEWKKAEPLD